MVVAISSKISCKSNTINAVANAIRIRVTEVAIYSQHMFQTCVPVEITNELLKGRFRPKRIFWGFLPYPREEKGQLYKLQNHKPACYDSFAEQEKETPERKLHLVFQSSRKENDQ